jgi:hypothetical protein
MMTIQELSDRQEILDLLDDYTHAIDQRRIDALDELFAPDALIDYSCYGGPKGNLPLIKAFLHQALPLFKSSQHMTGSRRIWVEGDTARARSIVHNPMILERDGAETVAVFGLWYNDTFVRKLGRWWFQSRSEERCYAQNLPSWFAAPPAHSEGG